MLHMYTYRWMDVLYTYNGTPELTDASPVRYTTICKYTQQHKITHTCSYILQYRQLNELYMLKLLTLHIRRKLFNLSYVRKKCKLLQNAYSYTTSIRYVC